FDLVYLTGDPMIRSLEKRLVKSLVAPLFYAGSLHGLAERVIRSDDDSFCDFYAPELKFQFLVPTSDFPSYLPAPINK
ncbi:hypothetical protein HAX54_053361, partial [Datura stramonium]|nr:hypothetical protein [Datura stramonium]